MKLEQIKDIIDNYEKLYQLASSKIEVLEKLDSQYSTLRGIEDISFYDDVVSVSCDNSCMGCYDTHSFSFPIIWLSINDSELEEIVIIQKEFNAENKRKLKEEKELKEKQEKEQLQLEQYQLLKAKFEH